MEVVVWAKEEMVFTELLNQTGIDWIQSSHGLQQVLPPEFDLHCTLGLQHTTSEHTQQQQQQGGDKSQKHGILTHTPSS